MTVDLFSISAALYEVGDYSACLQAVLRSWRLLRNSDSPKPDLTVRLSTRLAKTLCHGTRARTIHPDVLYADSNDMTDLREAAVRTNVSGPAGEEHGRVWREWDIMAHEVGLYAEKGDESLRKYSTLPMFFKPLDPTREFFSIGTDEIIDLTEGWGPTEPYPLKLDELPTELLASVSFFFGGVGDGRHALGTIAGVYHAYKKLPKAKQDKFHAHLTLLDIHDATIARDLCVLMLLHQLSEATDSVERAELKATLTYTFCGVAMPDYCADRLKAVIHDLRKRLSAKSPKLPPWLHVASDTITAILPTLDFWLSAKKTTARMLETHESISPADESDGVAALSRAMPGGNKDFQRTIKEREANNRAQIENVLRSLTDEQLAEWEAFPEGMPIKERRKFVKENMKTLVDQMYKAGKGGKVPLYEEAWYKGTKVFLPPKELLSRHPSFEVAWKQIRAKTGMAPAIYRKIVSHIDKEWRPNITLFDLKCADPNVYSDGDGYPDLRLDMFHTIAYMDQFNRRSGPNAQEHPRTNQDMLAAPTCGTFFEEVAAAIKGLGGRLTVELICGGLAEELGKMQYKADVTRPPSFPRKYTRMWLSNVPDYTHGTQNVIIYAVPTLQDNPQAAVAFNSLLNTMVWANDDEFFHTYSLLLPEEVPRYLGCRVISSRAVMDVCVLGAQPVPRPLSELATREELMTYLTRILFNTFIPGHTRFRPHNVRAPHNLVAFFSLLLYLHRVGYPPHWLSEFIARVLSGSMMSDIAPFDDFWPMPVKERLRRVPPRRVHTDPWLIDFENIIATAYYAIPFPITAALPTDFSRSAEDIQVWEVRVRPAQYFSTQPFMNFSSPYDPRATLLFYRPTVATAGKLIDDMARIFEGKAQPRPGTFFVLTMTEYVQYESRVRFKLSRKRVEWMRKEGWSMMMYRHDTGQQATLPVPVEKWAPVTGDAASST
ncbi:hypothetical protein BV20DRAFT_971762 [Pilatotrama ljubarskyi]|nr:hypothetical protein BV20DRAFT_971762 [Pilatotrama ljubarskyi]